MENRIEHLRNTMAAQGVEFLAIGPGAHMQWLVGFHPHADERPCLFCLNADHAAFLMPALNAEGSREHTYLPFYEWSDDAGPTGAFEKLLGEFGASDAKTIALDETMRADFAALVQDALPGATRQFTETTLGALRQCKDAEEYALLKANALIADQAMQTAWNQMAEGMSELEVAQIIRACFSAQGAKPLFSIVGAGGNGAFPHHQTGTRKLAKGDAVVMDIGGGKDGYSSDITRMAVIGSAPEGYEEVHQIVDRAVQAALAAARPGVQAKEVDLAARGVITDAGYGGDFVHRTGHGLGVGIHETPYFTSGSETVLGNGMGFSIETGIYFPGRFGIRLGEIGILREEGPENLSELPRDFNLIA
ncbi:MAG: M24 family metallopeptidase [Arenibacterium sp.]